jgi:hypothetical protein
VIDESLHNMLVSDATLNPITGDCVSPVDPGDEYPCLSYWCTGTDFGRKLQGRVDTRISYYQIDVWSTTRTEVNTLVERLIVMFGNHVGVMGTTSFKLQGSAVENVFDVPEMMKDGGNNKVFHTAVEVHLMYTPNQ